MPLNYSKWDALELSDDSDIEEHPNIDKKSMINWKKRDIHEKREQRRMRIEMLRAEIAMNGVLLPRLEKLRQEMKDAEDAKKVFSNEVERLKTNPSDEKPPTGHAKQPTYDDMILNLLMKIWGECKTEVEAGGTNWTEALIASLEKHEKELEERSKECEEQAEKEEQEQKKKITSEDVHDGFSTGFVNKVKPSPMDEPEKSSKKGAHKGKGQETVQAIEVLNPGAAVPATPSTATSTSASKEAASDDDDDSLPELTSAAKRFSDIPLRAYDKSFAFIQADPSVLAESTTDALLAEAFEAELKGEKQKAKRCVHQGLLVQYCRKLGKDGVRLFFQRMQQSGPKAEAVFQNDVNDTYARIEKRVAEIKTENSVDRETIQLVAEDPSTEIGFNIPDGPPPENLVLEGEGTENLDVEEVKKFLQLKWELYESFPDTLKKAMQTESLVEVNKVLEKMSVEDAEEIVQKMQDGGMLRFSESGVRDMTGE